MIETPQQTTIKKFLKAGFLLSPEILKMSSFDDSFLEKINTKILSKEKPVVICDDIFKGLAKKGISNINWIEFEKSKVLHERGKTNRVYTTFLELIFDEPKKKKFDVVNKPIKKTVDENFLNIKQTNSKDNYNLVVTKNFLDEPKPRETKDFVYHYKNRYEFIKNLLVGRSELQNTISINRCGSKDKGEKVVLIGSVYDKRITKKGNIMVNLEDTTGNINVIFPSKIDSVDFLCEDEIIGVVGKIHGSFVFASEIVFPDISENNSPKFYQEDVCAAFISDVHVGSNMFIEDRFLKFLDWLNGKHNDQKMIDLSKKIKYLFVVGDVVDGVGIYPGQDEELTIKSVEEQYNRCAELFGTLRKDIKIILCPGNHDAKRIAEPQPALDKYADALKKMDNLTLVSNPSMVNVLANEHFEGFNILLYHGYSYDYYAANIEPIASEGGYDRGDLIMKFLLQKRHLSPVHASTLFVPNSVEDPLIISKVPDIFVSGHIHKSSVSKYKGVTNIVSSCWQYKTEFQEKVGHHPEYCKVPIFNFKTGESIILDFSGKEISENER